MRMTVNDDPSVGKSTPQPLMPSLCPTRFVAMDHDQAATRQIELGLQRQGGGKCLLTGWPFCRYVIVAAHHHRVRTTRTKVFDHRYRANVTRVHRKVAT